MAELFSTQQELAHLKRQLGSTLITALLRSVSRKHLLAAGVSLVVLAFLLIPHLAAAAPLELPKAGDLPNLPNTFHLLPESFTKIWDMVVTASAIVFMVLLLIGGVQYLASSGNDEQTKKAKTLLIDAVIGIVLVLLAWPIGDYAIKKLGLDKSVQIKTTVAPGTGTPAGGAAPTAPAGGRRSGARGTTTQVGVNVTGASNGESLTLASASSSPSGYIQTQTINNGKAIFTNVPTDEALTYSNNGQEIQQATYTCQVSYYTPTINIKPLKEVFLDWLTPSALAIDAIDNFLGDDDRFSYPSRPASVDDTNSNGTATPVDDSQCSKAEQELNLPGNKVFVRVVLIDQTTTKGVPGLKVRAQTSEQNDSTYIESQYVSNSDGQISLLVNPAKTYSINLGSYTASDSNNAQNYQIAEKLKNEFQAPSRPLIDAKSDLTKENPAGIWTVFLKSSLVEDNDAKVTFTVTDKDTKPLVGKKLYVSQFQGQLDGSYDWSGNFNGGEPVRPDATGKFTVDLPIGQRFAVRYYSIDDQKWIPLVICGGSISKEQTKDGKMDFPKCQAYHEINKIY